MKMNTPGQPHVITIINYTQKHWLSILRSSRKPESTNVDHTGHIDKRQDTTKLDIKVHKDGKNALTCSRQQIC